MKKDLSFMFQIRRLTPPSLDGISFYSYLLSLFVHTGNEVKVWMDIDAVYEIKYHVIWVTKYRYKGLHGPIAVRAREQVI